MGGTVLTLLVPLVLLELVVRPAWAARPIQQRESATHVVTGVVQKMHAKQSKFADDGVETDYTVELRIDRIQKGEGVAAGDTIRFHWSHVTKPPSRFFPAAYGHSHNVRKGDKVVVYLMKWGDDYEVIYNSNGIEPANED